MGRFPEYDGSQGDPRYAINGVPLVYEPRCSICTSQYRRQVDQLLVSGISQAKVAEFFERIGEKFTRSAVQRHARRHLTIHQAAVRNIIEKQAQGVIEDVEAHEGFLVTRKAVLDIALQKGYEKLMNSQTEIEVKDLLAVIEKLEQLEAVEKQTAIDEMMRQFQAFASAVKLFVGEEQWDELYAIYKTKLDTGKVPLLESMSTTTDIEVVEVEEDEEDQDD